MKITAEFNSNEELLSFISAFSANSSSLGQEEVQAPEVRKEVISEINEEKIEDSTHKVNAEIVSEAPPTGEVIEVNSTPVENDVKEENPKEETKITKEMVRAIFTKLIKAGKGKEAKELTEKYGASKLPELQEEHYEAVYKEAEALL